MNIGERRFSRRGLLGAGLGLAAGAGALAACGSGSGGSSGSEAPPQQGSEEEGKLIVWGAVAPEAGPQALVDAFMAAHSGIEVEYVQYVNDEEGILKLDTALQGGVPIDVFFSYGTVDVVRRSQAGLALDLSDLARDDDRASIFVQDEPISTLVDGKLYSIPTTHFPNFVVINQDAMDAAGIEIPYDWTVQDYHEIAQEFKKSGFEVGAYNPARQDAAGLGGDYFYKEGGTESNFDHPLFKERLEQILAMEDDGSILTQERITAEGIGGYAQNYFIDGTFAMMLDGTIAMRYLKNLDEYPHDFRATFRPYPAVLAGEPYWNPGVRGDDVQIAAKSQFQPAAWTFVKYWMDEGAPLVTPSGKVSPFQFEDGPSATLNEALFGPDADTLFDVEAFEQTFFTEDPPLSVRSITTAFTEISSIKNQLEGEIRLRSKTVDEGLVEMKTLSDEAITKALSK